jgi:hypothetical protein
MFVMIVQDADGLIHVWQSTTMFTFDDHDVTGDAQRRRHMVDPTVRLRKRVERTGWQSDAGSQRGQCGAEDVENDKLLEFFELTRCCLVSFADSFSLRA